MELLIRDEHAGTERRVGLGHLPLTFGRSRSCDVVLEDPRRELGRFGFPRQ